MPFALGDPPFASRTGRGVRIAVIDSGVNAPHPHIERPITGVCIRADGISPEVTDGLGHGTAVAAAIREKAPDAELIAVKVFEHTLATSANILAHAIRWAAGAGVRLINLSLGTPNPARESVLRDAVQDARSRGVLVVSAHEVAERLWFPGSLPGAVGATVDWHGARDQMSVVSDDPLHPVLRGSAYPRPIPGVPRHRNLSGISFAVANVTGFLARLLEGTRDPVTTEEVVRLLGSRLSSPTGAK